MRTRFLKVQVLWYLPLFHGEHCLDQSRNPGSWLQVADVGLHGADQERAVCLAAFAVNSSRCLNFDRIAQLRPSSVGFEIIYF